MLRAIFVILCALIIVLATFVFVESYDLHYMVKQVESSHAKIDSLNGELQVMRLNVDRMDFIINQIREKHPKEVDDIINDTE